jgi:hypothetical protein
MHTIGITALAAEKTKGEHSYYSSVELSKESTYWSTSFS